MSYEEEVTELRARIRELEAELEEEKTHHAWSIARAEKAEARIAELEAEIVVHREEDCNYLHLRELRGYKARAEKAEAEIATWKKNWFEEYEPLQFKLSECQARVAEQEQKIIELAERLTKEQARVAELERRIDVMRMNEDDLDHLETEAELTAREREEG